ncbi:hypothetical protein ES288_A09G096300v1 [Gossypium darwinii]|uniref:Uncharacterized protein n=1 Tax=Gossypium darwinii TaxID=34276 RepID=A0A5D2F9D0_GOSDA|nr:hypothetical protein ES288_A09G096300v1 [Gossypium darwinii]
MREIARPEAGTATEKSASDNNGSGAHHHLQISHQKPLSPPLPSISPSHLSNTFFIFSERIPLLSLQQLLQTRDKDLIFLHLLCFSGDCKEKSSFQKLIINMYMLRVL